MTYLNLHYAFFFMLYTCLYSFFFIILLYKDVLSKVILTKQNTHTHTFENAVRSTSL